MKYTSLLRLPLPAWSSIVLAAYPLVCFSASAQDQLDAYWMESYEIRERMVQDKFRPHLLKWREAPVTHARGPVKRPAKPDDWAAPWFVLGVFRDPVGQIFRSFYGLGQGRMVSSVSRDLLNWGALRLPRWDKLSWSVPDFASSTPRVKSEVR